MTEKYDSREDTEKHIKRFGYSDDLKSILKNTADFLVSKMEKKE